ncbi:uncharacterized protein PST29_2094 [Pseudomonas sp. St29]|nr:uncharacterized protein PST29_2094 [Pseudomonas sp. St29]
MFLGCEARADPASGSAFFMLFFNPWNGVKKTCERVPLLAGAELSDGSGAAFQAGGGATVEGFARVAR